MIGRAALALAFVLLACDRASNDDTPLSGMPELGKVYSCTTIEFATTHMFDRCLVNASGWIDAWINACQMRDIATPGYYCEADVKGIEPPEPCFEIIGDAGEPI